MKFQLWIQHLPHFMSLRVLVKISLSSDVDMNALRSMCCYKFLDELQTLFEIKPGPLHTLPLQLMMLSKLLKFSKCPTLMLHSYLLAGLWTRTETCSSLTRLLTFGKFVQVVFFDTTWFHVAPPST